MQVQRNRKQASNHPQYDMYEMAAVKRIGLIVYSLAAEIRLRREVSISPYASSTFRFNFILS
jgi:hypothetical protein